MDQQAARSLPAPMVLDCRTNLREQVFELSIFESFRTQSKRASYFLQMPRRVKQETL
jgi:hypothetical protein